MSGKGHIDYILLGAVLVLLAVGVQMVYSSSVVIAHNEFGDGWYFLSRQVTWIALGLIGLGIAAGTDYHRWQKISLVLLVICVIALVLVLIPGLGTKVYGSSRWLKIGPLPLVQPSEFAKLAIVVYMADWLSRKGPNVGKLTHGSIPFVIILGIVAGLVLIEPDLGTTVIICAAAFSVFFVARANLFSVTFGLMPAGLALGWRAAYAAVSRAVRWATFVQTWSGPPAKGW